MTKKKPGKLMLINGRMRKVRGRARPERAECFICNWEAAISINEYGKIHEGRILTMIEPSRKALLLHHWKEHGIKPSKHYREKHNLTISESTR